MCKIRRGSCIQKIKKLHCHVTSCTADVDLALEILILHCHVASYTADVDLALEIWILHSPTWLYTWQC